MSLKKKLLWTAGAVLAMAIAAGAGFLLRPVAFMNRVTYARETLAGIESQSATVEGHRMHYLTAGPKDGQAVVLVHGLGGSAEDWLSLLPYLTRAGYRVYVPDLFGYGRSEKPATFSYSVRDEAGAVVSFMDALKLSQVNLGGWSMGGWIVQILTAEHPERVRRLMIFDSVGLYEPPSWNTNLFTPTNADEVAQLEELLMPHPPAAPGFVVQDILKVSDERAWIIHRALGSMMSGRDTTDTMLPKYRMPVLLAWGSVDRITPLELGEKMHRLVPQSELVVAKGCGHLAPRQCTTEMGPRIVAFLGR
ncbi:MAG: alpha/beta hydrolase [Terracidiphilus sp.]|nr:alpha/beta hydrolase [Terracidiphilus sp.]